MEVNAINPKATEVKRLRFPSSLEDSQSSGDIVSIPVVSLQNSSNNGMLSTVKPV